MIAAVDIGGTKVAAAAVQESGQIVARANWPTASLREPAAAVRRITEAIQRWSAEETFHGVGVGCTGPVDPRSGVIGNVDLLPGWEGFPLVDRLSTELALPVAMENDADAAALAESVWGAGKNARRFIYVTISTGVGAGVVLDGALYRGAGGAHPELGHHSLDPAGPLCYCGAKGCWESLASGPALVEWTCAQAREGDALPANLTARTICDLARQGHPLAKRAVAREGTVLGMGLANLVTIFCPDVIALGGGLMESADLFLDQARSLVRARCGLVPVETVEIVAASLGSDVALLGAARVLQTRL